MKDQVWTFAAGCFSNDARDRDRGTLIKLTENPEEFIDDAFATITNHGEDMKKDWSTALSSQIQSVFDKADIEDLYKIPSINAMDEDQIRGVHGKVVRFRCMVQDMASDQLMYLAKTTLTTPEGGRREKCLMFLHSYDDVENYETLLQENENVKDLRMMDVLHCTKPPGETDWVTKLDKMYNSKMDFEVGMKNTDTTEPGQNSLPGIAVSVKVYNTAHDLKMNDVADMYGILTVTEGSEREGGDQAPLDQFIHQEQTNDGNSSVGAKQIHLYLLGYSRNWCYESPQVLLTLAKLGQLNFLDDWRQRPRELIMILLTECFMGDKLVARYVLLNLLSKAACRMEGFPIASLPLCITNVPLVVSRFFNSVLQELVTKCVYVENVLEKIASTPSPISPRKNYELEKLESGMLQLSNGTHLLLQEEALTPAEQRNLCNNPHGISNLKAFQKLIEWQTVDYDFKFHQMEFSHEVPVLILSSSTKSAFKNVVEVPFEPTMPIADFETVVQPRVAQILKNFTSSWFLRDFFTTAKKSLGFDITDAMQTMMTNEFCEMRRSQDATTRMESNDFDIALTMCRNWLKHYGETELTEDVWREVQAIQTLRKTRLINRQSNRNGQQ